MPVSKIQSPYTPLETTEKTNEIIDQLNTNTDAIAAIKGAPTGSVIPFAGSAAPTGFLICDGSAISRTAYADLFAVIGTTYGAGDGSTTFNLPNCASQKIITGNIGVIGDGNALGLSDGSTAFGLGKLRSDSANSYIGISNAFWNKQIGYYTQESWWDADSNKKALGLNTLAVNSHVLADTSSFTSVKTIIKY